MLFRQTPSGARRHARRRRGAAAAELAVLAPLLAVVIMGMLEMGRAMMAKVALNDAARKACRAAILPGGSNTTVNNEVTNTLGDSGVSGGSATVTVQVNGAAADAGNAKQNDRVSVKVAVPYSQFAWVHAFFLSNATIESETVVMMRQQ